MAVFRRSTPDNTPAPRRNRNAPRITSTPGRRTDLTSRPLFRPAPGPLPYGSTTATTLSYNAPRGLTAAATQMKLNDKSEAEQFRQRRASSSAAWQSEAWEYYDAIGELSYAFNLVASVISRIRLYAAVIDDPSESPVPVRDSNTVDSRLADMAERALARLDSAYGGQAGLLRDAAMNLAVAGECYLVQIPAKPGSGVDESWDIRSVDELTVDNRGNYTITPRRDLIGSNKAGVIKLPPSAFAGRIWRAHPRFSEEPDSSMRSLLDLCAELMLLNRTFRATARSRLNAGALYLPDGLSVAASPDPDAPFDTEGEPLDFTPEEAEDEFEDQLIDAMTTPISDEESASAVVPLIIRGPADLGDKIKQFKFERAFDPSLATRSERVLDRILGGLDVPKDIITGLANVKYSNAQQIDDSLYKAHIEPMMLLIADSLTQVYLKPYLMSVGGFTELEIERIVIWYDPSAVATRNDRAADADSGFEKNAISMDAWRRFHGFSDDDAPTATETALRILIEHAMLSPELTEAMLTAVSPDIMNAARSASQAASDAAIPPNVQQALAGDAPTTPPADGSAPADPSATPATPDDGSDPNAPTAADAAPADGSVPDPNAPPAAPSGPQVAPGADAPPVNLGGN